MSYDNCKEKHIYCMGKSSKYEGCQFDSPKFLPLKQTGLKGLNQIKSIFMLATDKTGY